MNENSGNIMDYAAGHSTPEDEVLHKLYRETYLTTVYPRMASGHMQGLLLEMISRMIGPMRILEIGTFTGYSAICLARGLAPGGLLHTIDINDELAEMALRYFTLAGLDKAIIFHNGDALQVIPGLSETFDLVFIDGDKKQYLLYYEKIIRKVKTGGFILADNVLWSGKVLAGNHENDKDTAGICEFNEFVTGDARVEKLLLPFRDGLYILRKISS